MLLRRFADNDGRFYHFSRHQPEVCHRHFSNVFYQNHLYALPPVDGARDLSVERQLAHIEDVVSPILDRLEPPLLGGFRPDLARIEREALCLFLYEQWRRVPDFHDEIMPEERSRAVLEKAISDFEIAHRPLTADERKGYLGRDALREIRQRVRVQSLAAASRRVIEIINSKGLWFALTPARKSFLISSYPVVKIVPSGIENELHNPQVELWLPIHPRIMMIFAGAEGGGVVTLLEKQVRDYNLVVARRSGEFASLSKDLVASIARTCGRSSL
ncbi:Uncharacterised protein [Starkeya nomas]|uniref:DUF4238 domain-containing protein n=2 Tax=Starkeya nomas TaxID=2666134 RepID=A0A5S9NWE2_9HYPH|nr:Uncharacterised protein [Starkeya nomas]